MARPGTTLGCVYLTANSAMNSLTDGLNHAGAGLPFAVEATPGLNTIIANLGTSGGSVALYADQVRLGRVTNNVNIGSLGTTHCYVDASSGSTNTNVPLHLRAKGNSPILIDSHLSVEGLVPTTVTLGGSTAFTVAGSDNAGSVAFTTAASVAADANVAQVSFNTVWANAAPIAVVLMPLNAASAGAQPFVSSTTTALFTIALHNPPATATALKYAFIVVGAG